jgi:hypothetical protein
VRLAGLLLLLGVTGLVLWRAELFTVSRPGERPLPLARIAREPLPAFDVSLPVVPVGVERLTPGGGALLVHYWAPWERDSRAQVQALDSLVRTLPPGSARVAVVCFDPFPSVARYAARLRLTVPVMLDLRRSLQAALPCPSIPYTWLLDTRGQVLARQPGEVDWLAAATRALVLEAGRASAADTTAPLSLRPEGIRPRGREPSGPGSAPPAQAPTASARGRANQRARSAYPPNSAVL